jgi:hemolysin III
MPRSYFFLNKNELKTLEDPRLYQSDALIIEVADAAALFQNPDQNAAFLDRIQASGTELYLKLDLADRAASFRNLSKTVGSSLTGWVIPHASLKILNKMVMKVREYESTQKLDFGTLNFIAIVDNPEGVLSYRKIASYERVKAMFFDEEKYLDYLGLPEQSDTGFIRNRVALSAALSKKPLIDRIIRDDGCLKADLESGKKLGASSKATSFLSQIVPINEFFTPTSDEVDNAKEIISAYWSASKKERKHLTVREKEISPLRILRSQEILSLAKYSGTEVLLPSLTVKSEKLREASKMAPNKKFYTVGEEIGNAVTHGAGMAFSIVFMILLLIKSFRGDGAGSFWPYLIYSLSALLLYSASTLYHGLRLGSRAKKLFQKFDHMSIYLLIAGTYTPYTLIAIGGTLGIILCAVLWGCALVGLLLNVFWFGKFKVLHLILYLGLGWIAVFYVPQIISAIGSTGTILLLAGGVAYSIGIIFYVLKLFKFTHMIWHLFVLAGTILHFISIFLYC